MTTTQQAFGQLVGAIMGAAYDFRDAHISGSTNIKATAHSALLSAVNEALAAAKAVEQPKMVTDSRKAFEDYLRECDECAIVADVAGAFNAGWIAAKAVAPKLERQWQELTPEKMQEMVGSYFAEGWAQEAAHGMLKDYSAALREKNASTERKPLTEDRVTEIYNEVCADWVGRYSRPLSFARAIEAAHGITSETGKTAPAPASGITSENGGQ